MKTITIDLKSFCFGVLAMGAVLLMANKPASQPTGQPQPGEAVRRYQVVTSTEKRTIIMDTKTGRFLLERPSVGMPTWESLDFEQLHQRR